MNLGRVQYSHVGELGRERKATGRCDDFSDVSNRCCRAEPLRQISQQTRPGDNLVSNGRANAAGQYLYYGKVGGCVVTGNEDGVKACATETLYALSHIGYTIPPQADCGWIGEIGPGPSYGDPVEGSDVPMGYDSEFTNKNATAMSWNLMHLARVLKDIGGFPVGGNVAATWQESTNAAHQDPDRF